MCSVCWTHDSVLWGLGYFRATTEYRYNCMSIFKVEFPAVNEVSTLSSAHFFVNCQVITKIRWNELLSHRKLPSPYPGIKFPWKQVFHLIRAGWVSYRVPKGLCGTCVREVVEKCPCAEVLHCDCANIKGPLKTWNQRHRCCWHKSELQRCTGTLTITFSKSQTSTQLSKQNTKFSVNYRKLLKQGVGGFSRTGLDPPEGPIWPTDG